MKVDQDNTTALVRGFVRQRRYGVLSTVSVDVPGYPFGSITPYVMTHEGFPIILVSAIAQHTKNMHANAKVSLLIADDEVDNKQAAGRVTIVGDAAPAPPASLEPIKARYLRCFPSHKEYDDAHVFMYYQITPVRVRHIGGFGKISWIEAADWSLDTPDWADEEPRIIDHMN